MVLLGFGDEIDYEYFVEDGHELFDECFVLGMRDIGFQIGFVLEGNDEAVGETLVEIFRTDVGAPFVTFDGVDFPWKCGKSFFDGSDLFLRSTVLELEDDNVTVGRFSGYFLCF